jgi:hypothetical protein
MATARTTITDEDLLRLPKDGNRYEVVDGELRMSPAGLLHARVVARVIILLGPFVKHAPGDSPRRVLDKVGEYLQAGVRLVWVIDPATRSAVAYRSLTDVRHVADTDELVGR